MTIFIIVAVALCIAFVIVAEVIERRPVTKEDGEEDLNEIIENYRKGQRLAPPSKF